MATAAISPFSVRQRQGRTVETTPKKKVTRKRVQLTRDLLFGPNGFPKLKEEKVTYRGKGHEVQDLQQLLSRWQRWAFELCPLNLDDFIEEAEKICSTQVGRELLRQLEGEDNMDNFIEPTEEEPPSPSIPPSIVPEYPEPPSPPSSRLPSSPPSKTSSLLPSTPPSTTSSLLPSTPPSSPPTSRTRTGPPSQSNATSMKPAVVPTPNLTISSTPALSEGPSFADEFDDSVFDEIDLDTVTRAPQQNQGSPMQLVQ